MKATIRSRNILTTSLMTLAIALPALHSVSAQEKPAVAQPDREAPIRASVERFVTAYNAHDGAAMAKLFLPEAQIIDEQDNTIQGRANIETLFAEVFAESPQTGITVHVDSIRFIGTALAVESGTTTTVPPDGEAEEHGRYTVVHVLKEGQWLMGIVRDVPAEPTHADHLQELAWLVGDWVDESRAGVVRTSCRWDDNHSFLLQEISVQQSGQTAMSVSQRIGWDPLTGQFRSWVFESAGGYGESRWTPTPTGWLIKATSVNTDGSTTSATNHIEPTGLDRYVFRSVDRVIGNELQPPIEVVVVRQPPEPK